MTQKQKLKWSASALAAVLTFPVLAVAAPADPDQHQMFAVEHALAGAGYNISNADGVADESTRQALRSFQEDQPGLSPTGEVDDDTLAALGVKREDSGYDRDEARKAAEQAQPTYDPTQEAAPAGKAGSGEDTPEDEENGGSWLFGW